MQPLFIIRYSLNSENAMFTASELLERINSHIAELQFTRTPQGLYAPVTYVLSMGGKRIRPVLMLMAYNLYQEDITRIFNPATGIEVYHNYTLLHDDLMDRADRRRGKETVHKVLNDNTAILSGDAMLVLAYQFMAECPSTFLKEVKHFALDKSSWAYFLYEYAGIPGTLLCGWMSDKVFRGNRGATGVFFMTLVTIATIVYWMNPAGNPTVDMICMIVIGFLIYGPVMLIGLHALELAPKKAAGTAAGFTGLFGYLGGSVAASAIVGYTVDFFGWDGGFMVMIGGSILAVILLIVVMIGEKRRHEQLLQKRNGG